MVQVVDGLREGGIGIVVALDGKNSGAMPGFSRFQDHRVGHVAQRQQHVGAADAALPVQVVDIG
jgi:hypothetical protein